MYVLFQTMGLRHLPVVDDANDIVGIITRKVAKEVCTVGDD